MNCKEKSVMRPTSERELIKIRSTRNPIAMATRIILDLKIPDDLILSLNAPLRCFTEDFNKAMYDFIDTLDRLFESYLDEGTYRGGELDLMILEKKNELKQLKETIRRELFHNNSFIVYKERVMATKKEVFVKVPKSLLEQLREKYPELAEKDSSLLVRTLLRELSQKHLIEVDQELLNKLRQKYPELAEEDDTILVNVLLRKLLNE